MSKDSEGSPHQRWAHLRFSIVGRLLAAPPEAGQLQAELRSLADKLWRHPITGKATRFGVSTIQRWYYAARAEKIDPVTALRRKVRTDSGRQRCLSEGLRQALQAQYRDHQGWSYQLHVDNLAVRAEENPQLGPMPSYSSVLRYMKGQGLIKKRQPRHKNLSPGQLQACQRLESREVRSFEATHTNALWHLDFHHGSRKVVTSKGQWVTPMLLAVLDDHSRLVCHVQWYLSETASDLIHGLSQAFVKRGLPRALMTDNGSAMMAAETCQGLLRLGIHHQTTLPYSPYQNGKQEVFWAQVEGRLMAMLENCSELTLSHLNVATQAWAEMEYQRATHSEISGSPLERFLEAPTVGRQSPSSQDLRLAFCTETSRRQRRSDGTISLEGIRFEIASRYGHLERITVRYAGWDLAHVYMVDERSSTVLTRLYPLDKTNNADGRRRVRQQPTHASPISATAEPQEGMAPLLRKLMQEYAATGLPPAYLPKINLKEDS